MVPHHILASVLIWAASSVSPVASGQLSAHESPPATTAPMEMPDPSMSLPQMPAPNRAPIDEADWAKSIIPTIPAKRPMTVEAMANNEILSAYLRSPRLVQSVGAVGQAAGFVFGLIAVRSDAARQFHYIRQDFFMAFGNNDGERIARLRREAGTGPNPIGSSFQVHYGENYVFVPICADRLEAKNINLTRLLYGQVGQEVSLPCR